MKEICPKCGKKHENLWSICDECGYTEDNKIATLMANVGMIIIVGGILLSLISAFLLFNIIIFILGTCTFVILGIIFLGISEIITLNQKIFSLLRK